jgi:hypothetical protein
MATQLSDLHDSLGGEFPRPTTQENSLTCSESERLHVFEWLSSVKYMTHHRIKFKALLPGSGQWLFEKQEFLEWRKSSVSSILWLHGIRELLPALEDGD